MYYIAFQCLKMELESFFQLCIFSAPGGVVKSGDLKARDLNTLLMLTLMMQIILG